MIRTYLGAFAARVFAAIAAAVAFLLAHVFVFTAGTQAIAQAMTAHCAHWRCSPQQPSEFRQLKPVPARRFGSAARRLTSFANPLSAVLLLALATLLTAPMPIQAAGNAQLEPCPAEAPVPTAVAVTAVPIVVESAADEYFVLYVTFDVDGTELRFPVAVTPGEAGTTTLAENVEALPAERYRVEKYLIADPADVDGDCVDDITELNDLGAPNPVNPAPDVPLNDGAVAVPDTHTYDALAIGGYFKFALLGMDTDRPSVYFINANTHPTHQTFLDDRHINRQRVILGTIAYRQNRVAPDGSQGVYLYSLNTLPSRYSFSFSLMERTHTLLAASMPLLENNLALYVRNRELPYIQSDLPLYRESRINLVFDGDVYSNIDFLALNLGGGVGRLQVLDPDGRPHPRDIVLYEALPNELPRVAGIISTVPQTPLSHVNLRAIQDGIPNAYIRDIRDDPAIAPLIGNFVRYEVTEDGYSIRAATKAEVDAHYEASPASRRTDAGIRSLGHGDQTPQSDRVRGLEGVRRQGGQRGCAGDAGFSRGNGSRRVCDPVLFLRRVHEGPRLLYSH